MVLQFQHSVSILRPAVKNGSWERMMEMDEVSAGGERIPTEAQLKWVRDERRKQIRELEKLDLHAGELATSMLETYGMSKSAIGRLLDVSQPHVSSLIERYHSHRGDFKRPDAIIPVIDHSDALDYLRESGRQVNRVIAAFNTLDLLLYSGLEPSLFREGDVVRPPSMLWQLDGDQWVGIGNLSVGYGGTGPGHAYYLLRGLGFSDEVAECSYGCRLFEINGSGRVVEGKAFYGAELPLRSERFDFRWPEIHTTKDSRYMYVARLRREDLPGTHESNRDPNSDHGPSKEQTRYEQWLTILDADDRPDWLDGPRVARVYTNYKTAREHGFIGLPIASFSRGLDDVAHQIILEQGTLQIWLPIYAPLDETQLLTDEAYHALDKASLYPADLANVDARSRFGRYLRRFTSGRPDHIDISPGMSGQISYIPH